MDNFDIIFCKFLQSFYISFFLSASMNNTNRLSLCQTSLYWNYGSSQMENLSLDDLLDSCQCCINSFVRNNDSVVDKGKISTSSSSGNLYDQFDSYIDNSISNKIKLALKMGVNNPVTCPLYNSDIIQTSKNSNYSMNTGNNPSTSFQISLNLFHGNIKTRDDTLTLYNKLLSHS